jgi:hypothetical protein
MKTEGQRVKRFRWIHGVNCVVRVEVDAVIPIDDPSEPCFEAETVRFLKTVREKADAGDVQWLKNIGEVYTRLAC